MSYKARILYTIQGLNIRKQWTLSVYEGVVVNFEEDQKTKPSK